MIRSLFVPINANAEGRAILRRREIAGGMVTR
jgi:hypothetical protein